ncbi:MAG: class II aldolase/adducin family protein [Candidatus Hermodarchaeota archaeon]
MDDIENDLRKRLTSVAKQVWEEGLCYGSAGNISAKIPETENVLIKPTGFRFCDLRPDDFLIVNYNTREVVKGDRKPSIETPFHTLMYQKRNDVGGVVHTHSHYATILSTAGVELVPMGMGFYSAPGLIKGVRIAKFAPPGSEELAKNLGEAIEGRIAAVLPHHGPVAIGKSIEEAYNVAKAVEDLAKYQFEVMQVGKVPPVPESMIKSFTELANKRDSIF